MIDKVRIGCYTCVFICKSPLTFKGITVLQNSVFLCKCIINRIFQQCSDMCLLTMLVSGSVRLWC